MTSTIVAVAPAAAQDQTPQGAAPTISVDDTKLGYGQKIAATGRVAGGEGAPVGLEFRPRGAQTWATVASTKAGRDGRYRLAVRLSRSGTVRVAAGAPTTTFSRGATVQAADGTRSKETAVAVAAHVGVTKRRLNVSAGRTAWVQGSLRRPRDGRVVALQAREGNGWRTLDRARTDAGGAYRLSYRTKGTESAAVRVRFGGDGLNGPVATTVGRLNAFRTTFASWYGPGFYGSRTACGQTFSAGIMGVAHKSLPCGTRVTFRKGSRIVRARVVDRGPFVGGREFDLSPAVKQRLGFGSTGTVQVAH